MISNNTYISFFKFLVSFWKSLIQASPENHQALPRDCQLLCNTEEKEKHQATKKHCSLKTNRVSETCNTYWTWFVLSGYSVWLKVQVFPRGMNPIGILLKAAWTHEESKLTFAWSFLCGDHSCVWHHPFGTEQPGTSSHNDSENGTQICEPTSASWVQRSSL